MSHHRSTALTPSSAASKKPVEDPRTAESDSDEDWVENDAASLEEHPMPTGWRHRATWLYLLHLLASLAAIIASFILSADALYSARHPDVLLDCDLNAKVSCSTVAQSWQAEIIKLGNLSFPNAYFGIAAESVFITIAVLRTLSRDLPTLVRAMRLAGKPGSIAVCILAALTVLVRHQRPVPVVHPSDVLNDHSVHGTFPRNSYGARAAEPPAQARHLLPAWRGPVGGCGVDRGYRRRHPCCGWVRYFLMTCIGLSSCHVVTLPLQ